jgi:hypothetical protein
MEKKQKSFLGFTVIVIAVFITVAGCDLFATPEFPSEFRGTWRRVTPPYTNTLLTITADTYTISSKPNENWKLKEISGDTYYITIASSGWNGSEVIKYVDGNLEIKPCGNSGEANCGGTWVKQ